MYEANDGEYVKLFRKIINWRWFTDVNTCHLFIVCVLKANWKAGYWKGQPYDRGQFYTSLESLSEISGLSVQEVRTSLKKLKSTNDLTEISTNKNRLITVVNYDLYQSKQQGFQQTSNKQATNEQQTSNNSIRIYKNNKNNKNIDLDLDLDRETASPRDDYSLSKPSLEDIDNYAKARQSVVDPKRFFDYYNNQGWTIKGEPISNWRAVFQSWEKKEKKKTAESKPVVILFEDRNNPPYYGFPAEWFDGASIVPERVRSGAYRYSEYDVQQLSAEEMVKTFNDVKEEDERQRKIYEYYERQRSDSGSDLSE